MSHPNPSPLAGQDMKIRVEANEIGGRTIRIEDWWDRVSGGSWMVANGNPAALRYAIRTGLGAFRVPLDDEVLYGKIDSLGFLVHIDEVAVPAPEDRPAAALGRPPGEADSVAVASAAGAPPAHGAPAHANCDMAARAYRPVKCDRCGREYVCTPSSDFYCTAEGDHCCEPCLIGDRPLITMNRPAADAERRYES